MDTQLRAEVERLVGDALASGEFTGPGGINDDRIYTKPETVKLLGVAPRTFDYMLARGDGPRVIQLSARRIGFLGTDIREALESKARDTTMRRRTPTDEDRNVIAEEIKAEVRCLAEGDHAGMAKVINESRYPQKLHLAAVLNVIARMANEADDLEQFLDVIGEIVARD